MRDGDIYLGPLDSNFNIADTGTEANGNRHHVPHVYSQKEMLHQFRRTMRIKKDW